MLEGLYQSWVAYTGGGYYPSQRRARLANPLHRALDSRSDAVGVGDVDNKELGARFAAQFGDEGGAGFLVQVEDGDVAAMLGQLDCCGATKARCSEEGRVSKWGLVTW